MLEIVNKVKELKNRVVNAKTVQVADNVPTLVNLLNDNPGLEPYILEILDHAELVLTNDKFDNDQTANWLTDVFFGQGLVQTMGCTMLDRALYEQYQVIVANIVGNLDAGNAEWFKNNASPEGLINVPQNAQQIKTFATDLSLILKPLLNIKTLHELNDAKKTTDGLDIRPGN